MSVCKGVLCIGTAAALVAMAAPTAWSLDTLKKISGESLTGDTVRVSAGEVVFKKTGGSEERIPADQIDSIVYGTEPAQLRLIRTAVAQGNYEGALVPLSKLELPASARAEVKQDVEFYRAMATARLALLGAGDVREAGKLVRAFVDGNANSYHYLPANETLGDLFAAVGAYEPAIASYDKLTRSPLPQYQVRGMLATGRALAAEQKYTDALARFDEAERIAASAGGGAMDSLKTAAILGKARSMAETGGHEEAIKLVESVLAQLSPEESELHAQAYVALGNAYRHQPDGDKNALLAYLHVDLLYSSNAAAHAEALYNLGVLWNQIGKPDRAAQATQMLKESYAGSVWAQR